MSSAWTGSVPVTTIPTPTWPSSLRRRLAAAAVVLAAAGPLAACSSGSTTSSSSPSADRTSAAGASTSTTAGGTKPVYEVSTGTVGGLGTVLVDGQGFTLYLFEPDKQSGKSTCYGTCAQGWPPLLLPAGVSAPVAGPGVDASLLGTTTRTDGSVQVTYDKWPLYLWVNDSQPGQATGQGLNNLGGLWYVLAPNGKAITSTPSGR